MIEVAWAAIAVLAATSFGTFWYLGAKIDNINNRIDGLGARLDTRIDALAARIDALASQVQAHIEHHAS